MMEFGTAAMASAAGASIAEVAHAEPEKTKAEVYLQEMCETLRNIHTYFANQPQTKPEQHETAQTFVNFPLAIRYKGYLAVNILVASASTFTVNISGVGPFTWTPNVGIYNRWRFPEGTTIQLLTPATPSQGYYPIDILYTDDTES